MKHFSLCLPPCDRPRCLLVCVSTIPFCLQIHKVFSHVSLLIIFTLCLLIQISHCYKNFSSNVYVCVSLSAVFDFLPPHGLWPTRLLCPRSSPGKNTGVGCHCLLHNEVLQAKMGSIKDRNSMDLTEAKDIKKRCQEYTEELYKKDLHDADKHNGVITHLEPDILECEVKWALESITTNKASGGDGIPVELFQILKDDAMKMLHSICQQIWKIQQWPQDWKRSVFIPMPKKGNLKECSNYHTVALISHTSKVMIKILQARPQQYVSHELPNVPAGFIKGRGTRDQIANIHWIIKKAREFQKNIYFCFIDYAKSFNCVDHNKLWKILKEMGMPDHLTCLLRNLYAGQEANSKNCTWNNTLVPSRKRSTSRLYIVTLLI